MGLLGDRGYGIVVEFRVGEFAPEPYSAAMSSPQPFPDTQWSSVFADPEVDRERWRARLGGLFEAYRGPVVCWFRAALGSEEGADDLCQGFFVRLMEREVLVAFDPSRGRFRHFLKGALRNFVREHWRAERALRRAGALVDLEASGAVDVVADAAASPPDLAFDRAYAAMVAQQAVARLACECRGTPRADDCELFLDYYVRGRLDSYEAAAARCGRSRDQVKNLLTAMRERFHAALLAVLRETTANPDEALASLREILRA